MLFSRNVKKCLGQDPETAIHDGGLTRQVTWLVFITRHIKFLQINEIMLARKKMMWVAGHQSFKYMGLSTPIVDIVVGIRPRLLIAWVINPLCYNWQDYTPLYFIMIHCQQLRQRNKFFFSSKNYSVGYEK